MQDGCKRKLQCFSHATVLRLLNLVPNARERLQQSSRIKAVLMSQPPGQQSMPHHFAPGVDRGRGKEALEFFPFNRRSMVILTRSDFSAPPNPSYLFCFRQSHKLNNSEHRHIAHSCELKFFPLLLAVWTAKRLVDLPRD